MTYRQDFAKLYTWAVFFFASFGTFTAYTILMYGFKWRFDDLALAALPFVLPVISAISYRWNFLELREGKLVRNDLFQKMAIPVESMQSVSFEETPARFLARFTYTDTSGAGRSFEITTASWNAETLLALTEEMHQMNSRLQISLDEGTKKKLAKDNSQKAASPNHILDWTVLTLKYFGSGIGFSVVLLLLLKI